MAMKPRARTFWPYGVTLARGLDIGLLFATRATVPALAVVSAVMIGACGSAPEPDVEQVAQTDSARAVERAISTSSASVDSTDALEVVEYHEQEDGYRIGLPPTCSTLVGGGGVVEVRRDGSARIIERWQ